MHNSKGHNGKGDWPTEYLEDLYSRIVEEEIKMEVDRLALPGAVMKAWMQLVRLVVCACVSSLTHCLYLSLQSNNKKEKKAVRRLVVLTEDTGIVVFTKSTEEPPFATIPLKGVQVVKGARIV